MLDNLILGSAPKKIPLSLKGDLVKELPALFRHLQTLATLQREEHIDKVIAGEIVEPLAFDCKQTELVAHLEGGVGGSGVVACGFGVNL